MPFTAEDIPAAAPSGFEAVDLPKTSYEAVDIPAKNEHGTMKSIGKQVLASVMDIPGNIVAIPGLVHALARLPEAIADKDGFGPVMEQAMDNPAMRLSERMRAGVNDITGAGEPEGFGEQAARLSSVLIPTPAEITNVGSVVAKGVPYVEKGLNAMGAVFAPTAQVSKDASLPVKAAQVGGQAAVALGADQGIRYATDQPNVFTGYEATDIPPSYDAVDVPKEQMHDDVKAWIVGTAAVALGGYAAMRIAKRARGISANAPAFLGQNELGEAKTSLPISTVAAHKWLDDMAPLFRARAEQAGVDPSHVETAIGLMKSDPRGMAEYFAFNGKIADTTIETPSFIKDVMAAVEGFTPEERVVWDQGMGAIKEETDRIYATTRHIVNEDGSANLGEAPSITNGGKGSGILGERAQKLQYAYDEHARISAQIQKIEHDAMLTEHELEAETGRPSVAWADDAGKVKSLRRRLARQQEVIDRWSDVSKDNLTITGKSGKLYDLQHVWGDNPAVSAKEQMDFLNDIDVKPLPTGFVIDKNVWGAEGRIAPAAKGAEQLAPNVAIQKAKLALKSNTKLYAVAKAYGRVMDGMLQYAVDKRVLSRELAAQFRASLTVDGELMYIPGMEANAQATGLRGAFTKLAYMMGWKTTEAKSISDLITQNLKQRAVDVGQGTRKPINAVEAGSHYIASMFAHVQKSVDQKRIVDLFSATQDATKPHMLLAGTTKGPKGVFRPDQINMPKIRQLDPEHMKNGFLLIQHDGNIEHWWVADPAMRTMLEFAPRVMEGINGVAAVMKNIYHALTTRNILFAPTQFFYSLAQYGVTAPAHGAIFHPGDAARGAWHVLSVGLAKEASGIFAKMLAKDGGVFASNPQLLQGFVAKLDSYVQKSFSENFGRMTGGQRSAYYTNEFDRRLKDVTERFGAQYKSNYGLFKGAMRFMDIVSRALQDGPLVGLEMKLAGQELHGPAGAMRTPAQAAKTIADLDAGGMQRVASRSRQIGGDFRAMGASGSAKTLAAWVPYSGAIIHGIAAIGAAAKKDPVKTLAALSAYVLLPTAAEYFWWNTMASDEEQNAYWTRYSDQMRTGNYMIPSGDATKPAMLPALPEFAFFRGLVIEGLDSLLGMSNNHRNYGKTFNTGQDAQPQFERDHQFSLLTALARVLNLPTPPMIQAAAALAGDGYQVTLGPWASSTGSAFPIGITPLGGTEKVSGAESGTSRFVDGLYDRQMEAFLSSLTGYMGTLAISVSEAFRQGSNHSTEQGFSDAIGAAKESVGKFVHVSNLWTGSATHYNANDATERDVRAKQQGFDNLIKELPTLMTGGTVANTNTMEPYMGNASARNARDALSDPLKVEAAMYAKTMSGSFSAQKQDILDIQKLLADVRSSDTVSNAQSERVPFLVGKEGTGFTQEMRLKAADILNKQLLANRVLMMTNFLSIEEGISQRMKQRGINVDFKFEDFQRPTSSKPFLPETATSQVQ